MTDQTNTTTPEPSLPPHQQERLAALQDWLHNNGPMLMQKGVYVSALVMVVLAVYAQILFTNLNHIEANLPDSHLVALISEHSGVSAQQADTMLYQIFDQHGYDDIYNRLMADGLIAPDIDYFGLLQNQIAADGGEGTGLAASLNIVPEVVYDLIESLPLIGQPLKDHDMTAMALAWGILLLAYPLGSKAKPAWDAFMQRRREEGTPSTSPLLDKLLNAIDANGFEKTVHQCGHLLSMVPMAPWFAYITGTLIAGGAAITDPQSGQFLQELAQQFGALQGHVAQHGPQETEAAMRAIHSLLMGLHMFGHQAIGAAHNLILPQGANLEDTAPRHNGPQH